MTGFVVNCFLFFIPVFAVNAVYYRKLPAFYQPAVWDNIPKALDATENVLRYLSFFIPILFRIRLGTSAGRVGLALYLVGLVLYFCSWLAQLRHGEADFAKTLPFRAAPAYTTVAWLAGIALIGESRFFPVPIVRVAYLATVISFAGVHTTHAIFVYRKQKADGNADGNVAR